MNYSVKYNPAGDVINCYVWRWRIRDVFLEFCQFSQATICRELGMLAGQNVAQSGWVRIEVQPNSKFLSGLTQEYLLWVGPDLAAMFQSTSHTHHVCAAFCSALDMTMKPSPSTEPPQCPPEHTPPNVPQAMLQARLSVLGLSHTTTARLTCCSDPAFLRSSQVMRVLLGWCPYFEPQGSRCSNKPT